MDASDSRARETTGPSTFAWIAARARLLCINSCIIVRIEMHHYGGRR
jgi:hypothetical protein